MIRQKEGACSDQRFRPNANRAIRPHARPSVAQKRADDRSQLSLVEFLGSCAVGTLFLFAFMWLAAAY